MQFLATNQGKYMSIILQGNETKAELLTICEENSLEVTDKKPTNTTLVDLIKSHPDYEENPNEGIPKLSEVPDDEIPGEVVDDAGNVLIKTTSKVQDIADDNERVILVTVTDHDNSQSIEDDVEGRLFQASWGNMICPPRRESVLVNGTEQYISRGMIKHMKTMTIPTFTTGADGKVKVGKKARFAIRELEGWSEEKLNALKEAQKGRM